MFGLLTRYVAVELLKTILLTTAVLVAVIAFGVAIKPLARNLLGGADILRYVAMASVPMLQYALPFAAGFGATLVMHRLASDNEILAMSAAGLSYRRILRPVILLGVALLLVMITLVNFVVPVFWSRMESMLARDVTRLLASAVERGEAFDLGDTRIYADDVMIDDDPEQDGVSTRLVLVGVAALQVDGDGRPETEFTAEYATLDLYRIDGRSILKLVLGDATVFRGEDETLIRMPAAEPRAIDLGHRLQPGPKLFTLPKMLELRAEPTRFWRVQDRLRNLQGVQDLDQLTAEIDRRFLVDGEIQLVDRGRGITWKLLAGDNRPGSLLMNPVVRLTDQGGTRETEVSQVEWTVRTVDGNTLVDLEIELAKSDDPDRELIPRTARSLVLADHDSTSTERLDAEDLMAWANGSDEQYSRSVIAEKAGRTWREIQGEIRRLGWDIDARIQQRGAQALTGPLLLLLGSVLAIRLRHATPLVVYVVAFLPAIADILLISGGEQTLRRGPTFSGHLLLWSGNALLAFLCAAAFWRLRRN